MIGRRRAMEDAVAVVPGVGGGGYDFFAVYDGHGGSRVADSCRDRMHELAVEEVEGSGGWLWGAKGLEWWGKVMGACFEKMDVEVVMVAGGGGETEVAAGSTAVLVMVGEEEVVVANCGDSRAVLCRGGEAVPLSRDHKPDRPDEKKRVEAAGAHVINWNGSRVQGVLATSRSIGDHYLKPYVISEPEVTVSERTDADDLLVIASDGLWDVVSNEVACEVVKKCFDGPTGRTFSGEFGCGRATEAAAVLAGLAIARGSKDNVSVIVVELKKPS